MKKTFVIIALLFWLLGIILTAGAETIVYHNTFDQDSIQTLLQDTHLSWYNAEVCSLENGELVKQSADNWYCFGYSRIIGRYETKPLVSADITLTSVLDKENPLNCVGMSMRAEGVRSLIIDSGVWFCLNHDGLIVFRGGKHDESILIPYPVKYNETIRMELKDQKTSIECRLNGVLKAVAQLTDDGFSVWDGKGKHIGKITDTTVPEQGYSVLMAHYAACRLDNFHVDDEEPDWNAHPVSAFSDIGSLKLYSSHGMTDVGFSDFRLADGGEAVIKQVDFGTGAAYVSFTIGGGYNGNYVDLYIDEIKEENKILDHALLHANHHENSLHSMSFSIVPTQGVHDLYLVAHNTTSPDRWRVKICSFHFSAEQPEEWSRYAHKEDKNIPVRDVFSDTWAATDDLGRSVLSDQVPLPREDKKVIAFYFICNGNESNQYHFVDIAKKLQEDPNLSTLPTTAGLYWGEPYFGYYSSLDPWVIRRHATQLCEMGVDAICIDVSNQTTYDNVILTIFETFAQMRAEGNDTPQILFMLPNLPEQTKNSAQHLYELIYKNEQYQDLWFRYGENDLPLMFGQYRRLPIEFRKFFEWRICWAWESGSNHWSWVAHTPQGYGYKDRNKDIPEEVSVSAAQHPTTNIGRSHQNGQQPEHALRYGSDITTSGEGLYMAEQFASALATDPKVIFLTGWNEWVAGLSFTTEDTEFMGWHTPKGLPYAVDCFSPEYSRDIEPMQGEFYDNYYYQAAMNLRLFKGARKAFTLSPETNIDTKGSFSQWTNITPEYRDYLLDNDHRSHMGQMQDTYYENTSGRNDIDTAKVTYDQNNVYFYVRTREPLTAPTNENWMVLYMDIDGNHANWNGFEYVVNRKLGKLERSLGGWNWETVADIDYRYEGNELMLCIPRSAILQKDAVTIRFKWADNSQQDGTIYDFMTLGDVAPDMRFTYVFDTTNTDTQPQILEDNGAGRNNPALVLPTRDTDHTVIAQAEKKGLFVHNGYQTMPAPCYRKDGKVYVPLRQIAEAMACMVSWDDATRTAFVSTSPFGTDATSFVIGQNADIINNRTYVEAKALSVAMGKSFYEDAATSTVLFGHSSRNMEDVWKKSINKTTIMEAFQKEN